MHKTGTISPQTMQWVREVIPFAANDEERTTRQEWLNRLENLYDQQEYAAKRTNHRTPSALLTPA